MPQVSQKKKQNKLYTARELVAQMIKFKENQSPYNMDYIDEINTPMSWWSCIDDSPNHLKCLAKKLFSIVPHSASCERIWSICGWMYGDRRTNLSMHHLEGMSKIHNWYLSNMKDELKIVGESLSEQEILELFQQTQELEEEEE